MSNYTAAKKIAAMCRKLSAEIGRPWLSLFIDACLCSYRHGASPENYYVLRFFRMPEAARYDFLTSGRSKTFDRILNKNAAPDELRLLGRKDIFLRDFGVGVKRAFLFLPECSLDELEKFAKAHPHCVAKPASASMGKGFSLVDFEVMTEPLPDFLEAGKRRGLLLEERIIQCRLLSEIHPDSVNTIRINAARDTQGKCVLIGACLKCGTGRAEADNFHAGGIAWPIDISTGLICAPGRDGNTLKDYTQHPDSGYGMLGLAIPFWTQIIDCIYAAMDRVPGIGYVGWDIAVTEDGPEIVEGNVRWPGGNIIQFDNIGKVPPLRQCIEK